MHLHPLASDLYISGSVHRNPKKTDAFFEADVRKSMLDILTSSGRDPAVTVVLDIGANIGLHTVFLAKEGFQVHSFEPNKANFAVLECNKFSNKFHNLHVNNFGLGESDAISCMTANPDNQGGIAVNSSNNCPSAQTILIKRLDNYLRNNELSPFLVKIDIEGYELKAFRPAFERWQKAPPSHILSEFSHDHMKRQGVSSADYLEFLWSLGYEVRVTGAPNEIRGRRVVDGSDVHKRLLGVETNIHAYRLDDCTMHRDVVSVRAHPGIHPALKVHVHPADEDAFRRRESNVSFSVRENPTESRLFAESFLRSEMLRLLAGAGNSARDKQSAIVFDVGAGIGLDSLFLASAGHRVYAFEPDKADFALLQCNMVRDSPSIRNLYKALNNVRNVQLYNFLLGPNDTVACTPPPYPPLSASHHHSQQQQPHACRAIYTTQSKRLDAFLHSHRAAAAGASPPRMIKLGSSAAAHLFVRATVPDAWRPHHVLVAAADTDAADRVARFCWARQYTVRVVAPPPSDVATATAIVVVGPDALRDALARKDMFAAILHCERDEK
ncbi:hypothetical protein HDU83_001706 [Entophlyctis luteolus]|nr:hypothetical protein HDU83_001706 [Entophlyctis luteolus]